MSNRRSPLARMIDEACGIGPDTVFPASVNLECPTCGKVRVVAMDASDPPTTATVLLNCPDCSSSGDFEFISYLDHAGNVVAPQEQS